MTTRPPLDRNEVRRIAHAETFRAVQALATQLTGALARLERLERRAVAPLEPLSDASADARGAAFWRAFTHDDQKEDPE